MLLPQLSKYNRSMRYELAIAGGGAVGASLARAMRGHSIALVSGHRPATAPVPGPGDFDPRVFALSPGSVEFLRALKVWDVMDPERLTPVHAMRVHGDAQQASIEMDAYRAGVPELAWIVEDRVLQAALWAALGTQDRLEIFAPAQCAGIELGDSATIRLADGRTLEADLLVGADGADSFVRAAAGIAAREESYGQTAVVANFDCEHSHRNTAFQWFQGGPVLALLPLPGQRVSMVWSVPDAEAARLQSLDAHALASAVCEASKGSLGSLQLVSAVKALALRRLIAERMVLPHLALAGDAAHAIHPLAGQGLNLGLQDSHVLGRVLAQREPVRAPGDLAVLRRYERERSEAILAMRATVHGLHTLFGSESRLLGRVRNLGMNLTDKLPVLKNALVRHALN